MEPASSSDDDSSIEQSASFRRGRLDVDEEEGTSGVNVNNFDDLPSEDSCLDSDSDAESESESESNSDDSKDDVEDMTLEDRLYAKQHSGVTRDLSVSTKKSKALEIAHRRLKEMKGKRSREADDSEQNHEEVKLKTKKSKSKHAPTCVSSQRSAYFSRGAPSLNSSGTLEIGAHRYKPRDPRHQSLSGHFDQNVFEERYGFLEEIQDKEIENLKERCKAWKATGKKGQRLRKKLGLTSGDADADHDQSELNRLLQERAARTDAKVKTAAKRNVKKQLRDDVASGKRGAYYLKKRELKKMELEAKFEELKRIGGEKKVNQMIAKRRKKKMGRDSSLMPVGP